MPNEETQTAATTTRSLVRKLAEVMAEVSYVPKTGRNKFHGYDYATEADIVAAVRMEMAKRKVMVFPEVDSVEWRDVTTAGGKTERACAISMRFTFRDGESGESFDVFTIGQGQDSGDKAGYKAMTGATKYALLKTFLIPTGDDPEAESPEAHDPAAEAAKKERAAGIAKLIVAFAAEGVTSAELAKQLGHPVEAVTNDEWTALRAQFKDLKAKKPDDEAAKAEKGIRAELDAKFKTFIERIKSAKTEAEIVLLQAEAVKANFPKPDLTALNRTAKDYIGLLAQPKTQPSGEDVPF